MLKQYALKQTVINCKIMKIVTSIDGYLEETEVVDYVDDSFTEDDIVSFLNNKYGILNWLGYNAEPE